MDSQMEAPYGSSDELIREKGYSLLKEMNKNLLRFNQGELKLVSMKTISKQLCLVEARIACKDFTDSSDPDVLMKILTEIKQFDLAL
jgi:hypothetical protein